MTPYREPGEKPTDSNPPRGLVRSNGCRCRCTPPGVLFNWWFDIRGGDRWFCAHGGAWRFKWDGAAILIRGWWRQEDKDDDE